MRKVCLKMVGTTWCLIVVVAILLCARALSESPSLHPVAPGATKANKLLLFMYDGMKWDSVTKELPGFEKMRKNGVHAQYLVPCYPTASVPNHFCVLTGNYPESHGMLANDMYDHARNRTFRLDYNWPEDADPEWWQHVEPIWATAAQQGKRVKVYNWMGCQMKMKQFQLSEDQCIRFEPELPITQLQRMVDEALTQLANDKLDFVAIYHDNPDMVNHHFGVNSNTSKELIQNLDNVLLNLQHKASTLTIYDSTTRLIEKLDLIVVSDHGHINYTKGGALNTYPIFNKYPDAKVLRTGQQLMIWPDSHADEIYEELHKMKNLSVYLKADIPDRWHFKHGQFVPPMLAGADAGYFLQSPDLRGGKPKTGNFSKSSHGYDNSVADMQAIFYARGPNFPRGKTVMAFDNVQLYQVMCAILGIQPAPNNGTWAAVEAVVVDLEAARAVSMDPVSFRSVVVTIVVALCSVLLLTAGMCVVYSMKQRRRTKQYRTVPTDLENGLDNNELDL